MIDPLISLIVAVVILALIVYFFLPSKGIYARWKKSALNTRRVLVEDALKHLYDFEYNNVKCTLQSIAGYLSLSGDETARLIQRLEDMGLVVIKDDGIKLTPDGRSYALRIIRIHRLWERYLADETSMKETEWHLDAEQQEHVMTSKQADELAAQMGNPLFDPHGDPIPTSNGEIPKRKGVPLTSLKEGEFAAIIHIEDEPYSIYSQLVAEGLYPGMQIRVIESTKERIKFDANGEEVILAPLIAANITVIPIKEEQILEEFKTLDSLKQGEQAVVAGISSACRGQQRRRLMDFGIVPGTKVSAQLESMGGDPVAYNIRGATIALRNDQAKMIYIKNLEKERLN